MRDKREREREQRVERPSRVESAQESDLKETNYLPN